MMSGSNDELERRVIERTAELSAANRELILEVAEHGQAEKKNRELLDDLKTARDKMARANKVKDEFLSVISHELRTPISIITGYAGMLKDGMLGEVNAKQKQALQKVLARSSEQIAMINDIVQVTHLEAGAVGRAPQEFDLSNFLDGLKSDYETTFLNQSVELRWDYSPEPMPMVIDKGKLKQALQNLINNALKFTDKGTVTVTARLQEGERQEAMGKREDGGESISPHVFVEFKVADTGIGISEEMHTVIFEKFRQVDGSETRSYGGVGLGLYIVKQFTEILGGRIEVQSEVGMGSTFTVRIPSGRSLSVPANDNGRVTPREEHGNFPS